MNDTDRPSPLPGMFWFAYFAGLALAAFLLWRLA
jgi:hypothetical protein